jgi:aldehyde:ferredoxin oxidoreductase
VHHANECYAQVGAVYNMFFNRDCMIHSAVNFQGCGLPHELKQQIAAEVWGDASAIDAPKDYTPMNEYKARFCWWSIVTDVLHDSLTLCNWVWPMTVSPTKERDYRGDLELEAKFYKAVTGEDVTTEELYRRAAGIMSLQRANTVRGMNTTDMRNRHDVITEWVFTMDPDVAPFTAGTEKLERADWQDALGMVYRQFGWDETTGALSRACLESYGMDDVADEIEAHGLLV